MLAGCVVKCYIFAGSAGAVRLAHDGRGGAVSLFLGQSIFSLHVIAGLNRHRPQGDKPGTQNDADVLAPESAADPVPKVRPRFGDR